MNLLILHSSFQTDAFVEREYAELLSMLKTECQAEIVVLGDDTDAISQWKSIKWIPDFIMTATGGVENLFKRILDVLPSGIRLIADGRNNSLAAALEILSFLTSSGYKGQIVHGSNVEIVAAVKGRELLLNGTRIGCFGQPSDWLIDSNVDRETVRDHYGVSFIDIDLLRLEDAIRLVTEEQAAPIVEACMSTSKAIVEPSNHDLMMAAKTYIAIRKICQEERLTAMTIRCFDVIKNCGTTSCLALALLNDNGIVAGCEGDLQTLLTMILVQKLCGEVAFMANPSILSDESSLLAHCTLPLSMCDEVVLRSHFESLSGVAIQGVLPLSDYTVLKWGGRQLEKFHVAEAKALPNVCSNHFCRTQILLDANLKPYLLNRTIGNHQVVIKGRHAAEIRRFMDRNGVAEIV